MSGHGEGKARVPTFDGKIENYEEFGMQWNAFAQVEGFSEALLAKGQPEMPYDYTTAIPDEGKVKERNKHVPRRKMPRQWLITLWHSSRQG
jgi:hypothetical protein